MITGRAMTPEQAERLVWSMTAAQALGQHVSAESRRTLFDTAVEAAGVGSMAEAERVLFAAVALYSAEVAK
jgi:hypothetical protein